MIPLIGSMKTGWGSLLIIKGYIQWLSLYSQTDFHALESAVASTCLRLCSSMCILFCSATTRWLLLIDLFELCIDCVGLSCWLSVISGAWNNPKCSLLLVLFTVTSKDLFWANLSALCSLHVQMFVLQSQTAFSGIIPSPFRLTLAAKQFTNYRD